MPNSEQGKLTPDIPKSPLISDRHTHTHIYIYIYIYIYININVYMYEFVYFHCKLQNAWKNFNHPGTHMTQNQEKNTSWSWVDNEENIFESAPHIFT